MPPSPQHVYNNIGEDETLCKYKGAGFEDGVCLARVNTTARETRYISQKSGKVESRLNITLRQTARTCFFPIASLYCRVMKVI